MKGAVYCLEEEATSFLPRTGPQHLSGRVSPGYHSVEITEFAFVTSWMLLIPPHFPLPLLSSVLSSPGRPGPAYHEEVPSAYGADVWKDREILGRRTPGAHHTAEVMIIIKTIT